MPFKNNHFDLDYWKITFPADLDNNGSVDEFKGDLRDVPSAYDDYFFYDTQGHMVFVVPVEAPTTTNSNYARTELRERKFKSDGGTIDYEWDLDRGGSMSAKLSVESLSLSSRNDKLASVIIGQIHGDEVHSGATKSQELVRLYYNENGEIYFANDVTGSDGSERDFYLTNNGDRTDISLGETFSYRITAYQDRLLVQVQADGKIYKATTAEDNASVRASVINEVWQNDDVFYFKAGAYQGVKSGEGSGNAKVVFEGLDIGHRAGDDGDATGNGLKYWDTSGGGLLGNKNNNTIIGTAQADVIKGRAGDDDLRGKGGNDKIYGNSDNDILIGGLGRDWLKGGGGDDIFRFQSRAESYRNAGEGEFNVDAILDFSPGKDLIDLTGLGYHSLGDGRDGTLDIVYVESANRTYLKDREAGSNGDKFEIYLEGDYRSRLDNDDFIFMNQVIGTSGPDSLAGTDQADLLDGLAGRDTLRGNGGPDIFRFSRRVHSLDDDGEFNNLFDGILDFNLSEDRIDLSRLNFSGFDTDGGSTENSELRLAYSEPSDRTYVRSDQVDFEFFLKGDFRGLLTDDHVIFDIPVT